MNDKNNIPAFPLPEWPNFSRNDSDCGMTLRDYFAAAALQGIASQYGLVEPHIQIEVAGRCYHIADAMLFVREIDFTKPEREQE